MPPPVVRAITRLQDADDAANATLGALTLTAGVAVVKAGAPNATVLFLITANGFTKATIDDLGNVVVGNVTGGAGTFSGAVQASQFIGGPDPNNPTFQVSPGGGFTGTLFTGSGAGLDHLNASALTTGIAPPARLGTGTADPTRSLRGDQTWQRATTRPGLCVAAEYGVLPGAVGVDDRQPGIQALIDQQKNGTIPGCTDAGTIELPPGQLPISRPLLVTGSYVTLRGSTHAGTELYAVFRGAGAIFLGGIGTPPATQASLLTGAGTALTTHAGGSNGQCLRGTYDLDTGGRAALTVSYAVKHTSLPADPGFHLGQFPPVGVPATLAGWSIYSTADGKINVGWGTQTFSSAGGVMATGTVQCVELTFDGTTVRVWVGVPGGTTTKVIEQASSYATVPVLNGGLSPLSVGYQSVGVIGGLNAFGGVDGAIDAVHVSGVVRHAAAFAAPTAKPAVDADSLFVCNWVYDAPFWSCLGSPFGGLTGGVPTFIPATGAVGQTSNVTIEGLFITSGGIFGNGINNAGCQHALYRDVLVTNTLWGYSFTDDTSFSSALDNCSTDPNCAVGLMVAASSMDLNVVAPLLNGGGVVPRGVGGAVVYLEGDCNATLHGGILTPGSSPYRVLSAHGGAVVLLHTQVDDEGQAGGELGCFEAVAGAGVTGQIIVIGGQIGRTTVGPLVTVGAGAAFHSWGTLFSAAGGTAEIISFPGGAPADCSVRNPVAVAGGIPISLNPEWVRGDAPRAVAVTGPARTLLPVESGVTWLAGTHSGGTAFTLPAAPTVAPARPLEYPFAAVGAQGVTVVPAGADTLTGGPVSLTAAGQSARVVWSGPGAWAATTGGASPAAAVNPLVFSPLAWWKADAGAYTDAGTTLAADGQSVEELHDSSGLAYNLPQATSGQRPLWVAAARNGLPVVRFDGVDDTLLNGTSLTTQPATVFIAGHIRSVGGGSNLNDMVFNGNSLFAGVEVWDDGTPTTQLYAGASVESAGTAALASWGVLTVVLNGASSAVRLNRVQILAGDAGTHGLTDGFALASTVSGGRYCALDVGEVLVYGALTTPQILAVEQYLQSRWGTP